MFSRLNYVVVSQTNTFTYYIWTVTSVQRNLCVWNLGGEMGKLPLEGAKGQLNILPCHRVKERSVSIRMDTKGSSLKTMTRLVVNSHLIRLDMGVTPQMWKFNYVSVAGFTPNADLSAHIVMPHCHNANIVSTSWEDWELPLGVTAKRLQVTDIWLPRAVFVKPLVT